MSAPDERSPGEFLSRWSRRKIEARAENAAPAAEDVAAAGPVEAPGETPAAPVAVPLAAEPLQPIDTLTPESDYRPFLQAGVPPHLKNLALKALFKDPHFNVMDGLDTYIADYSQPDPIPAEMLAKMNLDNLFVRYQPEIPPLVEGEAAAADAAVADAVPTHAEIEAEPGADPVLPPRVEIPEESLPGAGPSTTTGPARQNDAIAPNSLTTRSSDPDRPPSGESRADNS